MRQCPFWVKGRHSRGAAGSPLSLEKRTVADLCVHALAQSPQVVAQFGEFFDPTI
jgi:hypothetical protein